MVVIQSRSASNISFCHEHLWEHQNQKRAIRTVFPKRMHSGIQASMNPAMLKGDRNAVGQLHDGAFLQDSTVIWRPEGHSSHSQALLQQHQVSKSFLPLLCLLRCRLREGASAVSAVSVPCS